MTQWESYYDGALKKLIYNHAHEDAKERKAAVQRLLTNGLDFDQAGELLEEMDDELTFVHTRADHVWYDQTEPLLVYITEESEITLDNVGGMLHHLTPPELRSEYDIISTGR
ncbi:hypothetical protein [Halobaculum sp. MBLA0143]|uniref:hypothetical protein n=1 Tax=Halobaculum sp. MBLA0143 TaxID=3079933 RepID=UPI0035254707